MTAFPIEKTPQTMPGNILWLDAQDPSTITSSSNLVSLWIDKSNRKNNAVQVTTINQPSINVNTISGLPAISFNGLNSVLTGNLAGFSGQPYSIFTVGQRRSSAAFNYFFSSSSTAVNLGWRTDNLIYHQIFAGAINTISQTISPTYTTPTPTILAGTQSSTTRKLYVNSITSAVTDTLANDNAAATQFSLGFFNVYASIDLGEIIIFNRVLSDEERTKIIRYLSKRWGIAIS
jgi:hypothetical protein